MENAKFPWEISEDEWPAPEIFIEEAKACVKAARDEGLILRVMGGLAIFLHSQEYKELWEKLGRLGKKVFTDIDYVAYGKHRVKLMSFFKNRGFSINQRMLYHYGKIRQIYFGRIVPMAEIFYDQLEFNHRIPFKKRLEKDFPTFPTAELLLQKIQMVHMNEKDIKDSIILLRAHEFGEGDDNQINKERIADILCNDWGFYYTATKNLNKIKDNLDSYSVLQESDKHVISNRIEEILNFLEEHPKTLKWKSRSIIGTKIKWYNEVDDWDVIASQREE